MNIPGLITARQASTAVTARRLIINGASDGLAGQAVDGSALIIGVSTDVGAAAGDTFDVIRSGLAPVTYGGDVALGDRLTADANGRAVTAATGDYFIGYAEEAGAADEIGSAWIAPGQLPAA
ncbi:capsid cement protein [Brenneria populi subsp. brevivirga]|uniref:capsid cement protein n=1 Tax=Brenneria populi TaxID=1505588 RepID=UPI002E16EB51|nr:capsid cement protein [Brenneria populi subsp. brevivirga]